MVRSAVRCHASPRHCGPLSPLVVGRPSLRRRARSVVGARILEWCADRGTVAEIDHPIDSARGTVFYVENVKRNADGRLRRILNAAWPPVVAVGGPRVSAACAVTRARR